MRCVFVFFILLCDCGKVAEHVFMYIAMSLWRETEGKVVCVCVGGGSEGAAGKGWGSLGVLWVFVGGGVHPRTG